MYYILQWYIYSYFILQKKDILILKKKESKVHFLWRSLRLRRCNMKIAFSPPDISELEVKEVSDALRSGWITTGPRTKKLESDIAEYVGTSRCVCLNSQTACAEMALRALGVGEGDEVITSAYTYTASASVICHTGANVICWGEAYGEIWK